VIRILVTGGQGFLGRNLVAHLLERKDCKATILSRADSAADLRNKLRDTDMVFHLAGVNRPQDPIDFQRGNVELTEQLCQLLRETRRCPKIVFSSSMQATLDNPYGASKARAEGVLRDFASETGARVRIYRLKNLFGKWGRPNYNSVTATFCYNIANDLPINVSDPAREVDLSYVDDVVASFLTEIDGRSGADLAGAEIPSYQIKLGDLAGRVQAFHEMRATLILPDFAEWFNRALYATYVSYVPQVERRYSLEIKSDARGSLAEFVKQSHFGQVFVSRTRPGVTRGNHYHHTKVEKFFVVEGKALIRMRPVEGGSVAEYFVTGDACQVIDIPPGFTHSIANVGTEDLVTLFWSSEVFDPNRPDTYYLDVNFEERSKALSLEPA
jgi:UDP-2-acetamido-2,6-beta-L-arabino-hexul-4-ose reductase